MEVLVNISFVCESKHYLTYCWFQHMHSEEQEWCIFIVGKKMQELGRYLRHHASLLSCPA